MLYSNGHHQNLSLAKALSSFTKKCPSQTSTLQSIDSISTLDQTFEMHSNISCSLDEILLDDDKNLQEHWLNDDKISQEASNFLQVYDRIDKFLDDEGLFITSSEDTSHRKNSHHFVQLSMLPSLKTEVEDDLVDSSISHGTSLMMRRRLAAKKANSAKVETNRGCTLNSLMIGNFNVSKINSDHTMHPMEHPSA